MWVRESNKVLPDKTLSKEAWWAGAPLCFSNLSWEQFPQQRGREQRPQPCGVQDVPSPGITLGLSGWIRVSTGAGGAWEGTAQHSRGGKLQLDAHLGRAVSLLGKMFTQRTMSYFLCAQLSGGRVRCRGTQTAALAAAVVWARVCGHKASHSDLVWGAAILTWSSMPSAPCPQPDPSTPGRWGWQLASCSACIRLAAVQRNGMEGRGLLKSEGCPWEPER